VVEAWAERIRDSKEFGGSVSVFINRTPVTGFVYLTPDNEGTPSISGCGLWCDLDTPKKGKWNAVLNVTTPFAPITTMGKEPDLDTFADLIAGAIGAAIRKAHKAQPKRDGGSSIKQVVFDNMLQAVDASSGGGRVGIHQVYYRMRPTVMEAIGQTLTKGHFESIVTDFENEYGEIEKIYRDARGFLYEPGGRTIPLGTLAAEEYARGPWLFNKLIYIEKEGFIEALKDARWPEIYDCALMTGKGFGNRAARDIIDLLAAHDEPITVFCVHDADSFGTLIYQSLQKETRARGARSIKIIDLGLQPWDAETMGLEVERFERGVKWRSVADYVLAREDGAHWVEWLQSNRYELNAMTTPQFLAWITEKVAEHDVGKVIPPQDVLEEDADRELAEFVRGAITDRVLQAANVDGQVAAALENIERPGLTPEGAKEWLDANPSRGWRDYVTRVVCDFVGDDDFENQGDAGQSEEPAPKAVDFENDDGSSE
jgi:hypothetical protein